MAGYKKGVPFSQFTHEDMDKFRTAYVRSVLRNASLKWPARYLADKQASVGWGQKKCAACKKLIPARLRKLDHISPVVDPAMGFQGWDVYINRLLVYPEGWQVLCPTCHDAKTKEERDKAVERRKIEREKNPKPKKTRAKKEKPESDPSNS
jgi:hypothetical protein